MGTKRRGLEEERRLLANSTGSYMVSLPIELVRDLKWRQGQKLTIRKSGEKLVIEDWKE